MDAAPPPRLTGFTTLSDCTLWFHTVNCTASQLGLHRPALSCRPTRSERQRQQAVVVHHVLHGRDRILNLIVRYISDSLIVHDQCEVIAEPCGVEFQELQDRKSVV